ncbi:bromo adjacent homology domain-containing 1 protein [Corythoichthys intestinalis]|uniref:bromo adjacent homology domain-containing 1 protein n=1 Tax=Corythoichthys intestinalis TaxID=161448 RepID=UPI0025A65A2C|nr:bromo adjacent homology domain-containing 1 protein [Corythoichthys intestinalis]XP_057679537.1 bromo adjacent homology domain-containing 1 protein [Corythoichthys intestinalis]XP_057679538.1 bromo adjacent homology domain-containing 1 protein [Corythoichthys intestinalis]XP_057679539.1 bromo adjacent homology domain-containing 1 protein [Corythoichthys intestinalis]
MTHTKQKGSRWDRHPLLPQGGAMGGDQAERALRFGRTKKINEVIRRRKNDKAMKDKRANKAQERKWDRKLYPLRGRLGEGLSCRVLLTRLDESIQKKTEVRALKHKYRKGKLGETKWASNGKSTLLSTHVTQPRKRRLASLNAEAVNTLLLDRATDLQLAAKLAKRTQEEPANRGCSSDEAAPSKAFQGIVTKPSLSHKFHQISKKVKKVRTSRVDETRALSLQILDTPTPRRLAGLNAAALLKLTSSSAVSKQRVKSIPPSTTTSDCKTPAQNQTQKQPPKVKHKEQSQKQKEAPEKPVLMHCSCTACKEKADFEPKVEWESSTHALAKPGYQSRSMLGYCLKNVKEEQLETELSPCYCCSPEGSMEYCHRLAFFLGHPESGDQGSLGSSNTPVKRECLVTTQSLTHSHPALSLSPHPCLCYYVHITPHPPPAHTATSATLAPRPLNFAPAALCPNRTMGSKPLPGPRVTHTCFNSVASPCYGDSCGMGGYTCRAIPPVTSRGCTFSTGCIRCSHGIKTETDSSAQDDHSPSVLVPSSLPLSSCPLSNVPTSTQTTKTHLLTPVSIQEQNKPPPRARLKVTANHPSGASNGDQSSGPRSLQQKRIGRRRATNGWRPVGVPTEKDVFIAGEDETAPRQCYEGVERDGEVIRVRDTVLLRSGPRKKSLPYVAKISALWEDPKTGELMMSLFWYYRPEHTQGGRDPSTHCENEIFASRHQDENSVACIEDRCYVLPLAQYCRYCALMKRRSEGALPPGSSVVPCNPDFAPPSHRSVPTDVDPELVYLCRHVYDFRYGRILKNPQ